MIIFKRLTILFALLFGYQAHASTEYARQQQALDDIIKLANLDKQLTQFPNKIRQQLQQLTTPNNSRRVSQIQATFDPDMMRQALRRQINLSVLPADYEPLITRLHSPHLRKMLQMERDALGIVAYYERPIFIEHTQRRPVPEQRMTLIKLLNQAMARSELLIHADLLLHQQLERLLRPSGNKVLVSHVFSKTELDQPHVREQVLLDLLYTYRNATDEELSDYISFYRSLQGQEFITAFNRAWLAAISDITRDIAWRLKQPQRPELQQPAVYITRH